MSKGNRNNKLLGSGILLALTSSLCCIVPILALFGTAGSAMSMFNWVAPLRPYLLAATAIVLGIAFYRAYRPAKKEECGCGEKKSIMQSKRFLWIITILSIGLSTFPYYAPYFQERTPVRTVSANQHLNQTVIQIKGMSCAACEGHVNQALLQQKGVKQVITSYEKGESAVKFDSTQISLQQLAATIESETGYKVINVNTNVK
jgi:mercuric ion transport protein